MLRVIFYIDDERMMSEDYRVELAKNFEVTYFVAVGDINQFRQQIVSDGPALIVLDVMMPAPEKGGMDFDMGLSVFQKISDTVIQLGIPVILFSNRKRIELEAEVREMGFKEDVVRVLYKPEVGFKDLLRHALQYAKS